MGMILFYYIENIDKSYFLKLKNDKQKVIFFKLDLANQKQIKKFSLFIKKF